MAILPIIYLFLMVLLFVAALTLMWRNAYAINEMLNNPVDVRTKTKHPEMKEVKYGDRLMSIKFSDQFEDPMFKALGDRITELEEQKDDDDDEDDDGDVIVRI